MSTTAGDFAAVPTPRQISVTEAGASLYEQALLADVRDPANGIAQREIARGETSHASERAIRALQLQQDAQRVAEAGELLRSLSARYGLPPATILRSGPDGMRRAAKKLTEAA